MAPAAAATQAPERIDAAELADKGAIAGTGGDAVKPVEVCNIPLAIKAVRDTGKTYQDRTKPDGSVEVGGPIIIIDALIDFDDGEGEKDVSFFNPTPRLSGPWGALLSQRPGALIEGILVKDAIIDGSKTRGYSFVTRRAEIDMKRNGETVVTLPS